MSRHLPSAPLVAALSVALTAGVAPTELRLLPLGHFKAADGSGRPAGIAAGWRLDAAIAARLVAAADARSSDYCIDFEHQTLLAAQNGQPAPAAGWFKQLEFRATGEAPGLYATDVRWTPRAAALIAAGEYRYLSPVFSYAADGAVQALGPAALTNNPGLDGLTDLAALSAFFPQEEKPMKELLKALGLPEAATEAEALAALTAFKAAHGSELAVLKAAAPDPAKYVGIAVLVATQGELATARTELVALKAEQQAVTVAALVAEAEAAGKITPATRAWALDLGKTHLAALTSYLAAAPVVIQPGGTQTGGTRPAGGLDASDAGAISTAALSYQHAQAAAGITLTTVQAVAHVTRTPGA